MAAKKIATAAEVKAFVGKSGKGRIANADAEAFNAAHADRKYVAGVKPVHKVTVQAGRVRKSVNPAAARAAAVAAGLPVGKRGRLPQATLVALVTSKLV